MFAERERSADQVFDIPSSARIHKSLKFVSSRYERLSPVVLGIEVTPSFSRGGFASFRRIERSKLAYSHFAAYLLFAT